jgi:hypothetical protein
LKSDESKSWVESIAAELQAHTKNGTYTLCDLPPGEESIGSRFVFAKKYDEKGVLKRHKCRFVAQGFNQVEGVHFFETFAPTLNLTTFRMFLSFVVNKAGGNFQAMDVNTAFLIPELPEGEVLYMRPPKGFEKVCKLLFEEGQVMKLHKCIYGLKQASRYWKT